MKKEHLNETRSIGKKFAPNNVLGKYKVKITKTFLFIILSNTIMGR